MANNPPAETIGKTARAILFADIVDSTRMYRDLGDMKAESIIRIALRMVENAVRAHRGRLVKTIGDCAMCEFSDADDAATTALEIQRQHGWERVDTDVDADSIESTHPDKRLVRFRIGFTLGQVVQRDGDVYGDVVNVAARICNLAKAGQILTTQDAAAALSHDPEYTMRVFDRTSVKGVDEELVVVQLVWDRHAATRIITAPQHPGVTENILLLTYATTIRALKALDMPFKIGRDPGCELVVPSRYASRCHVRIEFHRGKCVLIDESTNGTFVLPKGTAPEKAIYLRNEAFTLLGRGLFALGGHPSRQEPHLVSYAVP